MMKHYFWKISLGTILIAYGLKIIFVPTVYYVRYDIFHDYTTIKWPFGGLLIIAGLFVFAYTFTQKAKKSAKKYSDTNRFWICKTCIEPYDKKLSIPIVTSKPLNKIEHETDYLYLDKTRYKFISEDNILEIRQDEFKDCPGYNKFKYGMENLYGYAKNIPIKTIRRRMTTRPVMFLLGAEDINRGLFVDKSCAVKLQGKNRFERGILYQHHLSYFVENVPNSQHIWIEIPGVGHNAADMFTHTKFIQKIKTLDF